MSVCSKSAWIFESYLIQYVIVQLYMTHLHVGSSTWQTFKSMQTSYVSEINAASALYKYSG